MYRSPLNYLNLDVWVGAVPGTTEFTAWTTQYPYFALSAAPLALLARRCSRELGLHASTDGHDVSFVVQPSMLPHGLPAAVGRSRLDGAVPVGRLMVVDVLDAAGRSRLPAFAMPAGGRAAA